MTRCSRFRNLCFTWNNYTEADVSALKNCEDFKFIIFGREVGESGTPHLQGYAELHTQMTFSSLKRLYPQMHIERRKGTAVQARDYCTKEDKEFFEQGTISNPGKRNDLVAFVDQVKANKPDEESLLSSTLAMRYPRHVQRVIDFYHPPKDLDTLDFHWYYGPTGTGKSRSARQENPFHYAKQLNKWWDNYRDGQVVIIDEWSPETKYLAQHLKTWVDHYAFNSEIKGSSRLIRPAKVIVTSNYTIEECFEGTDIPPLMRRFQVKEFS